MLETTALHNVGWEDYFQKQDFMPKQDGVSATLPEHRQLESLVVIS